MVNVTYVLISSTIWRNKVFDRFITVEEERLEGIKEEISKVLFHVRLNNATVIVINHATTIHHLEDNQDEETEKRVYEL